MNFSGIRWLRLLQATKGAIRDWIGCQLIENVNVQGPWPTQQNQSTRMFMGIGVSLKTFPGVK